MATNIHPNEEILPGIPIGPEKHESIIKTRTTSSRFAKKSTNQIETKAEAVKTPPTKRLAALASKDKLKMMENFNPDLSNREKKKLEKKLKAKGSGFVNDFMGVHILSGIDMCDCFEVLCPGCFFPCKKCSSPKCGVECRVNRRIKYESIEYHGFNYVKKNPLEK